MVSELRLRLKLPLSLNLKPGIFMEPVYYTATSADQHTSARWYHGKISRSRARELLKHGGFLVREVTPHVSYELMTSETTMTIRRQVRTGAFKVIGLPVDFGSMSNVVSYVSRLGWVGTPCHRGPKTPTIVHRVYRKPPTSPPPKRTVRTESVSN